MFSVAVRVKFDTMVPHTMRADASILAAFEVMLTTAFANSVSFSCRDVYNSQLNVMSNVQYITKKIIMLKCIIPDLLHTAAVLLH